MKLPVFIFLFLLNSVSASAQIERKPVAALQSDTVKTQASIKENDKQGRKDKFKELDLSLDQKIKLKQIRQANVAAKSAIKNNSQLSEPEKKKQLRQL